MIAERLVLADRTSEKELQRVATTGSADLNTAVVRTRRRGGQSCDQRSPVDAFGRQSQPMLASQPRNPGSWIDGSSGSPPRNQLLRNLGGGNFVDVTEDANASGGRRSVFTAQWLDANNDAWPDLYVIHEFGAGVLLVNQQDGTFTERLIAPSESSDFGSMGQAVGDVNNDGNIDLYVSNMYSKAGNRVMDHIPSGCHSDDTMLKLRRMVSGSQLHLNQGDLKFNQTADQMGVAQVGWSWGAAMADLNNDGWLDIHATAGFMSHDRNEPDG